MKLRIMSDLHFDHHYGGPKIVDNIPDGKDEVLVLAGDIVGNKYMSQAVSDLEPLCEKFKHTIYIPGNHEFYGTDPQHGWNVALDFQNKIRNFTTLTANNPVIMDGKRIIGDTMWFRHNDDNYLYEDMMNDFNTIRNFDPWVYDENDKTLKYFDQHVKEGDIVVTHHLPSIKSTPIRFLKSSINRFFICDMEQFIVDRKPALWIHGHTHELCDYMLGSTRIVCNPLGYPYESRVTKFNNNLVIEV